MEMEEGVWGRALAATAAAASGDRVAAAWAAVRACAVAPAPALEAAVWLCLAMSVMLVLEVCYMSIASFIAVELLRRVPERRYKWEPMPGSGTGKGEDEDEDEEAAAGSDEAYPKVLVQIPMYNEREVYKLSIGAACALTWPPDRIIIQVLDDSTDPFIRELVELECKDWASKNINIKYEIRGSRKGYKAGALKKGMEHSYAQECDFVAIFDADFQPEPDFLLRTVPFLVHNPKIALVQTSWEFVNYDVCLMTRIQKMSLDYHFKVEQESGSSMHAFFGFNGTAGVWRVSAITEAGGWKDRTTVEDMDLAVRASLKGWQFLYVGDIRVKSELPSTLKAYRHQQHRWTCGATHLFRKMAPGIVRSKGVSVWKKFHLLHSFFFVRRVIAPILTFLFYCIVIPLSVMVPEVSIPIWGMFYIPTAITIMNAIRNPWSIHLVPIWILFENVMSMHRMRAALTGLLETMYVDEWVVTEKVGDHVKEKLEVPLLTPVKPTECVQRIYVPELVVAFYLLLCASYDCVLGAGHYYLYIFLQAFAFIVLGLGFVGTTAPGASGVARVWAWIGLDQKPQPTSYQPTRACLNPKMNRQAAAGPPAAAVAFIGNGTAQIIGFVDLFPQMPATQVPSRRFPWPFFSLPVLPRERKKIGGEKRGSDADQRGPRCDLLRHGLGRFGVTDRWVRLELVLFPLVHVCAWGFL